MKQIAFVLFLTVLALGGFMLTQKFLGDQEERPRLGLPQATGGQGGVQAPMQDRPEIADGAIEVSIPDSVRDAVQRRRTMDWKPFASPEHVVQPEDSWTVDLQGTDYDADIVFQSGDITVDRATLRSYLILDMVPDLVNAMAANAYSERLAAQNGIDLSIIDQEALDMLFEYFCNSQGLTNDQGESRLAMQHNMPVLVSRKLWDNAMRASLGFFVGSGQKFTQAVPGFEASMNPMAEETAGAMVLNLEEGWAQFAAARSAGEQPSGEVLSKLLEPNSALNVIHQRPRDYEVRRRTWTFMDHELPAGVVAASAMGAFPEEDVTAPWLVEGELWTVHVDELWPLISDGLNQSTLEEFLRSAIWYQSVERALSEEGLLEAPEQSWRAFIELEMQYRMTVMTLGLEKVSLEGYPSLVHFRRMERFRRGFDALLPEGWDTEASLREYFDRNRVFIESWAPEIEVALFPPLDPKLTVGVTDWSRALSEARSMKARVDSGESYSTLRADHNDRLSTAWASARSQQESQRFDATFRLGNLLGNTAELSNFFQESPYGGIVNGRTLVDLSMAVMDPMVVSEPVRTPVGYVLVRVSNVRLRGLEGEFEDYELATTERYRYGAFRVWANEQVKLQLEAQ